MNLRLPFIRVVKTQGVSTQMFDNLIDPKIFARIVWRFAGYQNGLLF